MDLIKSRKKDTEIFPRGAFPDWQHTDAYVNYQTWSNRRWAWEFLRRNTDYIKICDKLLGRRRSITGQSGFVRPKARAEVACFGRYDLKHYRDPYGDDDDGRHWLAEAIAHYEWDNSAGCKAEHDLAPGQVSMVFDLTLANIAGPAVINSLLSDARRILNEQLSAYLNRGPRIKRPIIKPKIRKPRVKPEDLLQRLRIYDALVIWDAPKEHVIRAFFADIQSKTYDTESAHRKAREKALSKHLGRAKQMVKEEYQTLIPRDYA